MEVPFRLWWGMVVHLSTLSDSMFPLCRLQSSLVPVDEKEGKNNSQKKLGGLVE